MRIYTRKGDDGTTGLYFGGRARKDSIRVQVVGAVDEAQAAIGVARAEFGPDSAANMLLAQVARHLYVLMAEVATAPKNRSKLVAGSSLVTDDMVVWVEDEIDEATQEVETPTDLVVPGENRRAASLDLARTLVRRAERQAVALPDRGSAIPRYLNRLSDHLWVLARQQENTQATTHSPATRLTSGTKQLGGHSGTLASGEERSRRPNTPVHRGLAREANPAPNQTVTQQD
jgi:cob(I)alamin adenosyltransferase